MLTITLTEEQFNEVVALLKTSINSEYERARRPGMFHDESTDSWRYVATMSSVMVQFSTAKEAVDAIP
jgi:hypothetical protein